VKQNPAPNLRRSGKNHPRRRICEEAEKNHPRRRISGKEETIKIDTKFAKNGNDSKEMLVNTRI
jgi:hypothetical protein